LARLTDADAAPIWRLYEDETAAPILNGTMAKLDDANTTGLYSELVACTAGNGFEAGKTYTVYITATVDTDTGGITYGFKAMNDVATAVWDHTVNEGTAGAAPTTAKGKLQAVWNRFFAKKTVTATVETAYESDNTTAMETWTLADDDTTASRTP